MQTLLCLEASVASSFFPVPTLFYEPSADDILFFPFPLIVSDLSLFL